MKGINELHFSQAQLCEAIQYYLTNKLFNPNEQCPVVKKVELIAEPYGLQRAKIILEGESLD